MAMSNKRTLAMAALHLGLAAAFSIPPAPRGAATRPPSSPHVARVASSSTPPLTSPTAEDGEGGGADDDAAASGAPPAPWWKEFRLRDADLARAVIPDFPILSTRFDSDGRATTPRGGGDATTTTAGGTTTTTAAGGTKRLVYLDSAATSQKPSSVIGAISRYYDESNSNVHRGAHALSRESTELYENARDSVARFVGASSRNEIVFTSGATEAINLVATSLSHTCGKEPVDARELYLAAGDEIVITEMEHHSNIVPWQMAAERTGAVLKYVPVCSETGGFDLDAFREIVGPRTKFVSVQHVSNVLGSVSPVDEIVRIVRSEAAPGAKIMLDACQSVPHMPVDVNSLEVDFIAASGHKMCGPTGIGFLWGKESVLNSLAPYKGGGEMIDEVRMEKSTYAPAPARFEAGTPAIAQAIGLGAAIDYLNAIGMERIHEYEVELADYLRRRLDDVRGVTVLGPPAGVERAALCAFVAEDAHPSDVGTFLDVEGVAIRAGHHCCQPLHRALGYSHSARASLYFYNTKEDVDDFVEALEGTLRFFRSLGGDADDGGDGSDDDDDAFVPLF